MFIFRTAYGIIHFRISLRSGVIDVFAAYVKIRYHFQITNICYRRLISFFRRQFVGLLSAVSAEDLPCSDTETRKERLPFLCAERGIGIY